MMNHPGLGRIHRVKFQQVSSARFGDADDDVSCCVQRLFGAEYFLQVPEYLRETFVGTVVLSSHEPPRPHHWHAAIGGRMIDIHFSKEGNDSISKHFVRNILPTSRTQGRSKAYHACVC